MRTVNHPGSKIQLWVAVLGVSCLLLQSASATLLFTEAFNYTPNSALGGQTNPGTGAAWSGGNSGLTVGSTSLYSPAVADQGGYDLVIQNGSAGTVVATFANQTGGTVYYSFLFDPLVANGGNNYFIALNAGTTAPNGGSDAIDAYSYSSGKIEVRASPAAANAGSSIALTLGTTHFIVEEINLVSSTLSTASLWVDPVTGGDTPPTATATLSGLSATMVDNIGFKANSTASGQDLIGNVRVATTWAEVTPIPEPSTFALLGLGLGLMAAVIRRRRS